MAKRSLPPSGSDGMEARGELVADFSGVSEVVDWWTALDRDADAENQAWFAAVADRAAGAVTHVDQDAMSRLLALLRGVDARLADAGRDRGDAGRHAARAVIEVLGAMYDQMVVDVPTVRSDSEVGRVLLAMVGVPGASNAEIAGVARLEVSRVSRTGRRLATLGLARAARFGRENSWELTPRGRRVASRLRSGEARPDGQSPVRSPERKRSKGKGIKAPAADDLKAATHGATYRSSSTGRYQVTKSAPVKRAPTGNALAPAAKRTPAAKAPAKQGAGKAAPAKKTAARKVASAGNSTVKAAPAKKVRPATAAVKKVAKDAGIKTQGTKRTGQKEPARTAAKQAGGGGRS